METNEKQVAARPIVFDSTKYVKPPKPVILLQYDLRNLIAIQNCMAKLQRELQKYRSIVLEKMQAGAKLEGGIHWARLIESEVKGKKVARLVVR